MTNQQYRTLGFFFAFYESNLHHIRNFQRFKNGKLPFSDYSTKGDHTFPKFLSDFKVARNVIKGGNPELLTLTSKWIKNKNEHDVDSFAILINNNNLTHGKVMTSLSSKILFLNDPYKILPIDTQVRKSVSQKSNLYSEYVKEARKKMLTKEFKDILNYIEQFSIQVEKNYKKELPKISQIRGNRLLDIFLWSNNGEIDEAI